MSDVPLTIRQALEVFVDKYDRAQPADPHEIGLLHRHFAEARAALALDTQTAQPDSAQEAKPLGYVVKELPKLMAERDYCEATIYSDNEHSGVIPVFTHPPQPVTPVEAKEIDVLREQLRKALEQRDQARKVAGEFALVEWDLVTPPMPDSVLEEMARVDSQGDGGAQT